MKRTILSSLCILILAMFMAGCGDSDEAVALRSEGVAKYEEQEYEEAIRIFEKALDEKLTDTTEADIYYYIASCYMHLEQYDEAVTVYEGIPDYEKNGDALYLRGVALLRLERKEAAYESFDQAVAADDKNYELYIDVYLQMAGQEDEGQGEAYLQQVVEKVSGKQELAYLRRGEAYYYLGESAKAKTELEAAKEKGSSIAVMYLGMLEEDAGNYEAALKIYQDYIKNGSKNADLYNRMAACKLQLGDDTVLEDIQAGLELADKSVRQELLYHEVVAYELQGDYDAAREKAEEYLQVYPDDESMEKEYTFLKTR